jgi:hypothetical protein
MGNDSLSIENPFDRKLINPIENPSGPEIDKPEWKSINLGNRIPLFH